VLRALDIVDLDGMHCFYMNVSSERGQICYLVNENRLKEISSGVVRLAVLL